MSSPQRSDPPVRADVAGMPGLEAALLPLRAEPVAEHVARALDALSAGLSASAVAERAARSSVACGACAGRIALRDFVLIGGRRVTRTADCPQCGATTAISLA